MTCKQSIDDLVLAVFPSTRGFGYALFEGPHALVDWGVKNARCSQKNRESLQKLRELLAFYHPDVVVLEDYQGRGSRRAKRVQTLIKLTAALASQEGITAASFSRAEVRSRFGLNTKRKIAEAVVREFPELEPRLPPIRKIWMSEDPRMSIFDAVSLAITFFGIQSSAKRAA
jgi:hypothetical protein